MFFILFIVCSIISHENFNAHLSLEEKATRVLGSVTLPYNAYRVISEAQKTNADFKAALRADDLNDINRLAKKVSPEALSRTLRWAKTPEIAEILLRHGASIDEADPAFCNFTPLALACFSGDIPMAEFLLKHGADPKQSATKGRLPLDFILQARQ
ncbi:hypothetical protein HYV11_00640 [Candidatus Dependentiae bacterium]|nr:hypothetical protein [Candidatus Dependentiae bacterium]